MDSTLVWLGSEAVRSFQYYLINYIVFIPGQCGMSSAVWETLSHNKPWSPTDYSTTLCSLGQATGNRQPFQDNPFCFKSNWTLQQNHPMHSVPVLVSTHLKKPLQPSQVMALKWKPVALSPQTPQIRGALRSNSSGPTTDVLTAMVSITAMREERVCLVSSGLVQSILPMCESKAVSDRLHVLQLKL